MGVGLDIGSKTIKIVELSKDGDSFSLKASGIVGYKGSSIERMTNDKEYADLATAIKKLHTEAKISSREISVSLPEAHVYTRTVRFPLLTDSEIASAVKWEAEQYIPMPKEDAVIQHQVLEKREDVMPPQTLVLLVAAPKSLVEKYQRVVNMAGLKLVAVETELMSLVRSLAPSDGTTLVADLGARSADIAISKNTQLIFSRSIPTAGDAFTRAVAQTLGVDVQQAEEYKRTYGLSPDQLEGKIKASLDPVFSMVSTEMKKAIHFYRSEAQGDSPQNAVISGGTSSMPGAASALSSLLGIDTVVGNPFAKVRVDPDAQKSLASYAPLYAVAVGLAMRDE